MKKDKEKWIDEVFDSIKGSQRAVPVDGLFAKIENRIDHSEAKVISIQQWSVAAAVAVGLLFLNAVAIYRYTKSEIHGTSLTMEKVDQQGLISNYKIYE